MLLLPLKRMKEFLSVCLISDIIPEILYIQENKIKNENYQRQVDDRVLLLHKISVCNFHQFYFVTSS